MKANSIITLTASQSKTLAASYCGGIMAGHTLHTDIARIWNEIRGSDTTPADIVAAICRDLFQGIRDGRIYLTSGKTGVDWALLGKAFAGIASVSEAMPGVRRAWLEVHGEKLNSGLLVSFKKPLMGESDSGKKGNPPTKRFTAASIAAAMEAAGLDKKTAKAVLKALASK